MGQHVPQVLVRRVGVDGQELGVEVVAIVCPQKLLEPLPALGPVDGIAHAGGQQLHRILPQLGDLVSAVIQVDGIAHVVDRGGRVVSGALRDGAPDGGIFLVRHRDVDLMGGFAAADGEGVALAGDGLAG